MNESTLRETLASLAETGGEIVLGEGTLLLKEALSIPAGTVLSGMPDRTRIVSEAPGFAIRFVGTREQPHAGGGLRNLEIVHNPLDGLSIILGTHARDLVLEHLHLPAPKGVGILLADNTRRVIVRDCNASDAGILGFACVRDVGECLFERCVADRCGQSGVFLTDLKLPPGCDPLDFSAQIDYTQNVIGNFGPFSPDDPTPRHNTFRHCRFCHSRRQGITTDGVGYLRILDCDIVGNDCEGITLDNGTWCSEVRGCRIADNGCRRLQNEKELRDDFVDEAGLMPDGSSRAKLPGISLDNAAFCIVADNSIEGNHGDGVKFVRAGHVCRVNGNLIAENNRGRNDLHHFFGILLGGEQRQHPEQFDFPTRDCGIHDNIIVGPHYAGVHLAAETRGNTIRGNHIAGATFAPIENHTFRGNAISSNT